MTKDQWIAAARKYWPVALLIGLVVAFFADTIFTHKVLCFRDPAYGMLNFPQFVSRALKTDEFFPLWNPFLGHGKPHLADPESAFFYPIHWLYYLFPLARVLVFSYSFCVTVTGLSVYALCRHWKLDVLPALCGAVSMMFSTWLIATIEFRAHSSTFTWGPLEWLIVSTLIERMRKPETAGVLRNFWRIAALAGTVSLQYFAGYPQAMLYAQLFIGLYAVARCVWLWDAKVVLRVIPAFALAGAITAGVCMAQFLPSWQFIHYSERGVSIDPGLNMASFHPQALLTLLFPYLFGRTGYPNEFWQPTMFEFWVGTCYVGLFPLVAATFSFYCLKRFTGKDGNEMHRFLFCFCCAACALGLVLAAGKYTPIYGFFYEYLPGFGHFRWPSKFLVFVLYTLCPLAALGFQQLLDWRRRGVRPRGVPAIVFAWGMVLAVATLGYLLAQDGPGLFVALTDGRYIPSPAHNASTLADFGRGVFFLLAALLALWALLSRRVGAKTAGGIAIAVTFANLWFVSREIQPVMDADIYELTPKTLYAPFEPLQPWQIFSVNADAGQFFYGNHNRWAYQWGKDAAINAVLEPYGLFQEHVTGLKLRRYLDLYALLHQLDPARQNRLADLLNIRYVVGSEHFEKVFWLNGSREVKIIDRPSALPKAYVVDRFRSVPDFETAVRTMLDSGFDPKREVALGPLEDLPLPSLPAADGASVPGEVRRLHYQWNSVDLSVSAARKSLLVLTDTWFPGWKATVNGKPVPIYPANGYFRAVPLQPGENEVIFTYRPWQFTVGLAVTLTTLSLLAAAGAAQGVYAWRKRKR